MNEIDKIKQSINYNSVSPNLIGSLCKELHPEAENEINAIDIRMNFLDKLIRLKISANIESADDIKSFFTLDIAKKELMKTTLLQSLTNNYDSNRTRD